MTQSGIEQKPETVTTPFAAVVCRRLCPDWARFMAARFNAPIRLVGSSLWSPFPRDVDIRIVISNHEFFNRYEIAVPEAPGHWFQRDPEKLYSGLTQRWIDDMAKMNRVLATEFMLNPDVQVWPEAEWREGCDHRAPVIVLAAPSPKWYRPTETEFSSFNGVRDE